MAWIYLAASEETHLPLDNGLTPSPIVKQTDTLKPFCFQEWPMARWPDAQYGTTCGHSMLECSHLSTSSWRASRAKTSAVRDAELAWTESVADFSSRSCAWPKKLSPRFYSLKTCRLSEREGLTELSGHFPASGMTVAGLCYPLTMWERRTSGNDGSCWPTPTVCGNYNVAGLSGKSGDGLLTAVKKSLGLWPTPTKSSAKNGGRYGNGTPTLASAVGGSLNPTWVEWLMGFPAEWTALNALGMQLFPPKPKRPSKG